MMATNVTHSQRDRQHNFLQGVQRHRCASIQRTASGFCWTKSSIRCAENSIPGCSAWAELLYQSLWISPSMQLFVEQRVGYLSRLLVGRDPNLVLFAKRDPVQRQAALLVNHHAHIFHIPPLAYDLQMIGPIGNATSQENDDQDHGPEQFHAY